MTPAGSSALAPTWVAGILNHGDYDAVERCLGSLRAQRHPPLAIRVLDTGLDPRRLREISATAPDAIFESGPNRGYAGGANYLLRAVERDGSDPDYVLLLNPDVYLDPEFAQRLIESAEQNPDVALASGKLLRPGRIRIDSAGISLPRHRRPRDRGSEEADRGQYETREFVFAVSGAALLLRRSALPVLAIDDEVFDEDFFVYHEDTDLAWRARRLGWRVLYEPRSVAVHERGWRRSERFAIPVAVRRHSFKNHYLQMIKNERVLDLLINLPWIATWEAARFVYALMRDPALLPAYREAWRLVPSMRRKRAKITLRAGM